MDTSTKLQRGLLLTVVGPSAEFGPVKKVFDLQKSTIVCRRVYVFDLYRKDSYYSRHHHPVPMLA